MVDSHWAFDEIRDPTCDGCDLGPRSGDLRCLVGVGPRDADLMLIGEAPGRREVQPDVRRPFAGPVGQYLDRILENIRLDRESLYITNVICCHPPHDADPTPEQIKACKLFLDAQIKVVKPKRIMALGGFALKALTGRSGITKYRGQAFLLHYDGIPPIEVYASFHPSYVRRYPKYYPVLYTDLLKFRGGNGDSIVKSYTPVTDISHFRKVARELLSSPEISYDYETESLDPYTGDRLISIALSSREGIAYSIPLDTKVAPWTDKERKEIHRILGAILSKPNCFHIAFNSCFELKWSKYWGIDSKCDWDPMVAAGLLDENLPHDLGTSVQMYVDPDFVKLDSSKISKWSWDKVWPYNCGDADYTLRLAHSLRPRLEQEPSSQTLFDNLLMPFQTKVVPKLELNGIYIHEDKLQQAEEKCIPERDKWSDKILSYVPKGYVLPVKSKKALKRGFNPGSPKQLSDLLFNVFGLPDLQAGSTAEPVLVDLKSQHPIIEAIMEFRGYEKLLDFLESWKELKDTNGFIHPHYHLRPVTGRLSSTDPNLQQVPRLPYIRSVIGAPPGYILLIFDYSQIELRIIAHYSQDPEMIRAFMEHQDIHLLTAASISGISLEELRVRVEAGDEEAKEIRKKAKAVNFGLVFEMGAFGLKQYAKEKYEVELTLEEATLWRSKFFKKYNRIPVWHKRQIRAVHLNQQVVSMIGRVRHLNNVLSSDYTVVAESERQAINSPVQGLASDFNLMSAVEVEKILPPKDGWLAGLVHDESIYCIREDKADHWFPIIKNIMENPPLHKFTSEKFSVPIEVDGEISKYWS